MNMQDIQSESYQILFPDRIFHLFVIRVYQIGRILRPGAKTPQSEEQNRQNSLHAFLITNTVLHFLE
jgi:hypothetical protein